MVVTDPVLEASRRPGGLDTPEEALFGEGRKGVVHRLTRNGTDLAPDDRVDVVRGAVRSVGYRPEHSQTLGRDLQTVPAEKSIVVAGCLGCLRGHTRERNPRCWDGSRSG